MEREGVLDSGRAAGDRVGTGSHMRSMPRPGSGGDWMDLDRESDMERGHMRPRLGLGLGSASCATAADAGAGFGAARPQAAGQGEHYLTCIPSVFVVGQVFVARLWNTSGC